MNSSGTRRRFITRSKATHYHGAWQRQLPKDIVNTIPSTPHPRHLNVAAHGQEILHRGLTSNNRGSSSAPIVPCGDNPWNINKTDSISGHSAPCSWNGDTRIDVEELVA